MIVLLIRLLFLFLSGKRSTFIKTWIEFDWNEYKFKFWHVDESN